MADRRLDFANWSLYMDPAQSELASFTAGTGIEVGYHEVIDGNESWYRRIQPRLAQGGSIGFDLMVVASGTQLRLLLEAGLLAALDERRLPHRRSNLNPIYWNQPLDPQLRYTAPWASGITGIAYHPARVPFTPARWNDLWHPQLHGKVSLLNDGPELANLGMLSLGIDPRNSTMLDWQRAADLIRGQRDAGQIYRFHEVSDIAALSRGDALVAQAWSGDIFQANLTEAAGLQFVIPVEGGSLWTDNLTIPVTAEHPDEALSLIDFLYQVDVAATLTEYNNFISPVPAARDAIQAHAARMGGEQADQLREIADSPLVFPAQADLARLHPLVSPSSLAGRVKFAALFAAITGHGDAPAHPSQPGG